MKSNELMGQFIEKMQKQNADKKEIVSDYTYISWLEKFTLLHGRFADDSWLYKPDELSKEDNANVNKLQLFFEALSDYCHKYYIDIAYNKDFEVERINIKHNGVGYQLGLVVGQGAYMYVERKEVEDNAIDFCDIVNDAIPEDFEVKKALLKRFEKIVAEMKKIGVPDSVILEMVNK